MSRTIEMVNLLECQMLQVAYFVREGVIIMLTEDEPDGWVGTPASYNWPHPCDKNDTPQKEIS